MKEAHKQTTAEWARCYYDAWNRRDWEWIEAMLADDVEWLHTARDEKIRGTSAVISSFRSAVDGFPTAMIEVRGVHEAGRMLIVECAIIHAGAPSSNRSATFCEVMELSQGRCVRGTTYADSVRFLLDVSQTPAAA